MFSRETLGAQPVPEGAADTAAVNATTKPDRRLTKDDLQKKIPAFKNPQRFDLACSQMHFPAAGTVCAGFSLREIENFWSEAQVDRWIEAMRAKIAQIESVIGPRPAR